MPDLSTLRDLQRRLREATGPDREIDADICVALKYVEADSDGAQNIRDGAKDEGWQDDDILYDLDGAPCCIKTPPLTSSLDAAVALIERALPGYRIEFHSMAYIDGACDLDGQSVVELYSPFSPGGQPKFSGAGKSYALSYCIALVSALIATEEEKGENNA